MKYRDLPGSRVLRFAVFGLLCLRVPTVQAERTNFAAFQKVTASSQQSTYDPGLAVDGRATSYHAWRTADTAGPHWLEVTFSRPIPLGSAHVYGGIDTSSADGLVDFRLQRHNGAGWVDIPGAVIEQNAEAERVVIFAQSVTVDRIRLLIETPGVRVVRELALFPPLLVNGAEQSMPLGTDVRMNLAHQRPTLPSTQQPGKFGVLAVDGVVDDASSWWCESSDIERTLEIDLVSQQKIGSAHVYTGQGLSSNPLSAFRLDYWVGGQWQAIPGATISGNTLLKRKVEFTQEVETARIRFVVTDGSFGRVREVALFPPRSGGFPLGRDVRFQPLPDKKWDDFSDSTWRFVNQGVDLRLSLVEGGVIFGNGAFDGVEAIQWQVLLNHRDGSYRLVHPSNGLCLALADISRAENVALVVEPYSGLPHQDWMLVYEENGLDFRFVNAYSGHAVQSAGDSESYGAGMVVRAVDSENTLQLWRRNAPIHHAKKGLAATTTVNEALNELFPSTWSYTWGRQTSDEFPFLDLHHSYNPMQWGNFNLIHGSNRGPIELVYSDLQSTGKPAHLMGFNEPDKSNQANMSVEAAITRWPRLMAMDAPLVSPAPSGTYNGWLADFYTRADAAGYRADYTAIHWYAGPSADNLIAHLKQAYDTWGRPIWLTEFSVVRWDGDALWTEADTFNFLAEFLWRAESLPWLKRYSLFHFTEGIADTPNQAGPDPAEAPRSNSLCADGTLTPFGELYATWDGETAVRTQQAYHLHHHGSYSRLIPNHDDSLGTAAPSGPAIASQWFLVPGDTENTFRIISSRDGRPLRYWIDGPVGPGVLGLTSTTTEWRIEPQQHGRYFIVHNNTDRRLRINALGEVNMAPAGADSPETQWRFIKPLIPQTRYALWALEELVSLDRADQEPDADPDEDGVPNLLEFAFGTSPQEADFSPLTIGGTADSGMKLSFPWSRDARELQWGIRQGSNLSELNSWPVVQVFSVIVDSGEAGDRIEVSIPFSEESRSFFLLEVEFTSE